MKISIDKKTWQAAVVIIAMAAFGFFTGNRLFALPVLLIAGTTMILSAREHGNPVRLLGLSFQGKHRIVWLLAGLAVSSLLAIYYRFHFSESFLPLSFGIIALVGPLIGMTEELVFRGYIQGILSHHHPVTGILAAAAGHTLYKAILLGTSPVAGMIDMKTLVGFTFLTGCLYGYFRHQSAQVYAPLLGHGLFDLLVYGDQAQFPLWVWY